jgi:FtsZ-binding cell division protein ZapB
MSDIVQRLREWASTICTIRGEVTPSSKSKMAREAADEIERLRALWCEEKSKAMTFHAEVERLRAERDALQSPTSIMVRLDDGWISPMNAVREITRLRAEVAALKAERDLYAAEIARVTAERDALQLRWQRLHGEIDCRIEHGANSNGHLEAIRKMMREVQP